MIKVWSLLILAGISWQVNARNYTGVVRDKQGQKPLAYAGIGIPGKDIGILSGADGTYTIDIPDAMAAGTLVMISLAGYEPYRTSLREFGRLKEIPLVRIMVQSKKQERLSPARRGRTLGNISHAADTRVGFINDKTTTTQQPGYEIGTLIRIDRKSVEVDSVFLNFVQCSYDSLFFRVNIYEQVKDSFINIMPRPYYVRFSKMEALNGIRLSLRDLQIRVNNDFLLSLELLQPLPPGELLFAASYLRSKAYVKAASQGTWAKLPLNLGVGMSVLVRD